MPLRPKRSRIRLSRREYVKLCEEVHSRDNYRCRVCRSRVALHCHHIIFRSQGGDDASYNLISLCFRCHEAIHNRHCLVLPVQEGIVMDADKPETIKLLFVHGWKPVKQWP